MANIIVMIPMAFAMKNKCAMEVGKKELTDKKKYFTS
jgi:hypothetical protein